MIVVLPFFPSQPAPASIFYIGGDTVLKPPNRSLHPDQWIDLSKESSIPRVPCCLMSRSIKRSCFFSTLMCHSSATPMFISTPLCPIPGPSRLRSLVSSRHSPVLPANAEGVYPLSELLVLSCSFFFVFGDHPYRKKSRVAIYYNTTTVVRVASKKDVDVNNDFPISRDNEIRLHLGNTVVYVCHVIYTHT